MPAVTPESALDVVGAFVKAINQGNLEAMGAVMAEDHTFTDALGNSISGAEKVSSGWWHFFEAYPKYWIRVDAVFTQGTQVALFGEAGGQRRVDGGATPENWSVAAARLAETEGGKVKKWSVYCDTSWAKPPVPSSPPAEP